MSGNGTSKFICWMVSLALLFRCGASVAQANQSARDIVNARGDIRDSKGMPLPGAQITIKLEKNKSGSDTTIAAVFHGVTDNAGKFAIPLASPHPEGRTYTLLVEYQGKSYQESRILPNADNSWSFPPFQLTPANTRNDPSKSRPTQAPSSGQKVPEPAANDGAVPVIDASKHQPEPSATPSPSFIPASPLPEPVPKTLDKYIFHLSLPQSAWTIQNIWLLIGFFLIAAVFFLVRSYRLNKKVQRTLSTLLDETNKLQTQANHVQNQWAKKFEELTAAVRNQKTETNGSTQAKEIEQEPAKPGTAFARSTSVLPVTGKAITPAKDSNDADEFTTMPAWAEPVEPPPNRFSPIMMDPVQAMRPPAMLDDYERTRRADTGQQMERAICDFESTHTCIRLSLMNEKEVAINSKTTPEFEQSSHGWFLGIDEPECILCLPYFGLDLAQQMATFKAAFEYDGNGPFLQVTKPARLERQANHWILKERGRIESTS